MGDDNDNERGFRRIGEAEIRFSDGIHETIMLPVLQGTLGKPVLDIRPLFQNTKLSTYDPGFTSTASCHSEITYIDGRAGILRHRGYAIEELAEHSDFLDVSYLLLFGDLPNAVQREKHERNIKFHTMVHEQLIRFFSGFKSDAHPMAIMVGVVGALSAFYHDSLDVHSPQQRTHSAYRLIAKMPTIAAIAYKTSIGQPIIYPDNSRPYAENFLYMLFATPCEEYKANPVFTKAMDKILLLHADHEQNASTTTVRIAGSSLANPFACVAAGIASLWGPAHGGANEAVLKMLMEIRTRENIPIYIAKAKDRQDPFRLWGFGHRVYKNYDPRARIMKQVCAEVLQELHQGRRTDFHENEFVTRNGDMDPVELLELAQALEAAALADEYFIKRKLFPNVDFYTGIVMKAMGIPT